MGLPAGVDLDDDAGVIPLEAGNEPVERRRALSGQDREPLSLTSEHARDDLFHDTRHVLGRGDGGPVDETEDVSLADRDPI
jgi:hypothetical protein